MEINIDQKSGFCFGVVFAIRAAEVELEVSGKLYCLGEIVHNIREVDRLKAKGLEMIDHEQFKKLKNCKVMIRAHGEPPETYRLALENNIDLIDASCPVVLKLQNNIRSGYELSLAGKGQIVIIGKEGHAEVNGLLGQTHGNAIVVAGAQDIDRIDFSRDIYLYSQTTMSTMGFQKTLSAIQDRIRESGKNAQVRLFTNDTICRQVSSRAPQVKEFSEKHDVIIFVSDKNSSNGTFLYQICKETNPKSYFVTLVNDLKTSWFEGVNSVGISGATSTPFWVMEEMKQAISEMVKK